MCRPMWYIPEGQVQRQMSYSSPARTPRTAFMASRPDGPATIGGLWRAPEEAMRQLDLLAASLFLAFVVGIGSTPACAQDKYPSRPVKIVVPYAPGGATDIVARILGEQLRVILGQSFVVENK